MRTPAERIERVVEVAFRGVHHCDGWRKRKDIGWGGVSFVHYAGLATYDYDELTRLVVAAHEECVRVEIEGCGPRYLRIFLSPRVRPESDHDPHRVSTMESHPTIDNAVAYLRSRT
jgi:hypothetical protein